MNKSRAENLAEQSKDIKIRAGNVKSKWTTRRDADGKYKERIKQN